MHKCGCKLCCSTVANEILHASPYEWRSLADVQTTTEHELHHLHVVWPVLCMLCRHPAYYTAAAYKHLTRGPPCVFMHMSPIDARVVCMCSHLQGDPLSEGNAVIGCTLSTHASEA